MDDKKKGKWAKVADEIRCTMSKESSAYLQECSREVRDGFELRDLSDREPILSNELDEKIRSLKSVNPERAKRLKDVRNEFSSLTPKSTRKFFSEDERVEYYKYYDKKTRREYLEEKYELDKDTLVFEINDSKTKSHIKDHSDWINESYHEALHDIIKEHKEMKLLLLYDNGKLSIGQVAEELAISKSEVMDLLKKYGIPFVRVDEEYLKQEFEAFEKTDKSNKKGKWADFAERMDGIFTSDIVEHIEKSRKELRDED